MFSILHLEDGAGLQDRMQIGPTGVDPVRVSPGNPLNPSDTPICGPLDAALRVVIVDNNHTVRLALTALLEANGFTVVGATEKGSEATELVDRLSPDVVILDQRLGDTTGLTAARAIRCSASESRVILYTTHPPTPEASRAAGVHEVIIKQGSPTILLDALRAMARERSKRHRDSGADLT